MIIHPIGAEVKSESGLHDACTKSLLGIRVTQREVLAYERTVDVVDVLGVFAVREGRVQDGGGGGTASADGSSRKDRELTV